MVDDVTKGYSDILNNIIEGTKSGKVTWIKINPTTYSWESSRGVVNIQRVSKKKTVISPDGFIINDDVSLLLQAYDVHGNIQVGVVSGEYPELKDALESIFRMAADSVTSKGIRFLKGLLD